MRVKLGKRKRKRNSRMFRMLKEALQDVIKSRIRAKMVCVRKGEAFCYDE
jgi:hypothetical protein